MSSEAHSQYAEHHDVLAFVQQYKSSIENMNRLVMLVNRLDVVIPSCTRRMPAQRIGQTFWNYVMESCVLPVPVLDPETDKPTAESVGLSVMFQCDDPAELDSIVSGVVHAAVAVVQEYTGKHNYIHACCDIEDAYVRSLCDASKETHGDTVQV